MSICARRVHTYPLRGSCAGASCAHLCTRVRACPLRGPCVGASCAHSYAAGSHVSTARSMRWGFLCAIVRGGVLPFSPSVSPPAAFAACWKRGRSVREISPLWKEFFLKFTSGNRDKPVQSSGMEPGVSARRGAASAPCFHIFPSISRFTRVFSFSDCFTDEITLLFIFKSEFF